MRPLSQEYVDNCPREGEFRLRGMEMTRIEVFVDAAFAFALLGAWFPLVDSGDTRPGRQKIMPL